MTPPKRNLRKRETRKLHPHQMRAWQSKRKVIALVGGTGAGKTWFAPLWCYRIAMAKPGSRVLCIGTGYERHVSRVMMHEITRFLKEMNVPFRFAKNSGEITLPNESKFLFGSSENPLSLEGPHLDACWIDEAGLMSRIAWDVAQRRTGFRNGPILITTIPYFEGWLKTDVHQAWLDGDVDIEWIACRTADNPDYSEAEIERMRKTLPPAKFRIFYEGEWARPEGVIFPEVADHIVDLRAAFAWNECQCCKGGIPHDWPAYAGHDWGYNAPTTGVWARLSPDDVLYIVADYEVNEQTIEDHLLTWRDLGLFAVDEAYGDPANPEQWERANEFGYPIVKATNAISAGIDTIYNRLQTGRLKISTECRQLIDYFASYHWAKDPRDENRLLDIPAKPQDAEHLMDALRYLCMGIEERGTGTMTVLAASRSRTVA